MQRSRYYVIALCTMLILCWWIGVDEAETEIVDTGDGMPYVGGEVLVKYRSDAGVSTAQIEEHLGVIGQGLQRVNSQPAENVTLSIKEDLSYIISGLVLVSVSSDIPLDTVIPLLESSPLVEYAEPNYSISLGF